MISSPSDLSLEWGSHAWNPLSFNMPLHGYKRFQDSNRFNLWCQDAAGITGIFL